MEKKKLHQYWDEKYFLKLDEKHFLAPFSQVYDRGNSLTYYWKLSALSIQRKKYFSKSVKFRNLGPIRPLFEIKLK